MELGMLFLLGFTTALIPGPDILFVLRNTLNLGFKQGFLGFLGIFSGWLVFLSLIYFGFSSFIQGDIIQASLSFIGGIYLIYISYELFRKKKNQINFTQKKQKNILLYFKGLFINLSNPKAILFFATIISPFMQDNLENSFLVLLSSLSLAFIFVIFLATFFRRFINNSLFDKIDKVCSIIFLGFGAWLFYLGLKGFLQH